MFTCFVCWSAGKILLAKLHLDLSVEETQLFRFVCGSACVSLLVFLIAAAGVAKAFTLVVPGLMLIAWAWLQQTQPMALPLRLSFPRIARWLLGAALCVYLAFYLVNAVAPEASSDGMAYHLALVKRYLAQRGFGRITTNFFASFPEGLEMLFLMAFSIGRHSAASLVEFGFFLSLPIGMFVYSRRFGNVQAGLAAAVWIFLSPVFAIDGTVAYNDVAGACVVFCGFFLLQIWAKERKQSLLILIGTLAGFAYAIKYPLFVAVPYAAGFVLWKLWRQSRSEALRSVLIVLGCAAVTVVPWMIKNWITVANPFSPFFNKFFPNPYVTIALEKDYLTTVGRAIGVSGFSRLIDNMVGGGPTAGLLGPIFLLAPLALVALRSTEGRNLLLAAVLFGLPAIGNASTRFLMPAAPFVALALALVVSKVRWAIPVLVTASFVLSWPTVVTRYCNPNAWRLTTWPVADALRLEPEPEILKRRLYGGYELNQLIEASVPPKGRIFSFGSPQESYINREVVSSYQSAYAIRVRDVLWNPLVNDRQATWRIKFAFTPRSARRLRVLQTATGSEQWSIAEFRIFD